MNSGSCKGCHIDLWMGQTCSWHVIIADELEILFNTLKIWFVMLFLRVSGNVQITSPRTYSIFHCVQKSVVKYISSPFYVVNSVKNNMALNLQHVETEASGHRLCYIITTQHREEFLFCLPYTASGQCVNHSSFYFQLQAN